MTVLCYTEFIEIINGVFIKKEEIFYNERSKSS